MDCPPPAFTLPLFTLQHVLFPRFPIQLHVFEERYKVMINDCIERNQPFGVILIREGSEVGEPAVPHDVGCITRILAANHMPDGRINLFAAAEGRFRLLEYYEAEVPYLIGRVELLDDAPAPPLDPLVDELTRLFLKYLGLLAERAELELPDLDLPNDPTLLAFCVGWVTQIPAIDKQRLLETTDPRKRLEDETLILKTQIEALESQRPATEKGAGSSDIPPRATTTIRAVSINGDASRLEAYNRAGRN